MKLILDHVTHIYDPHTPHARTALRDVSLQIGEGSFIGLIGHTGSGKSTLIQHLNGLLKPTEGSVYADGKDIADAEYNRRALRGRVGLVFQYPEHQLFEADVFKDVCFGPKNLGLTQKETELRAYEALQQVGLEPEVYDQSPFDLSGGQKRRVAIAGVLAMRPEVLILDEPTAGLDPGGSREILSLIASLQKERGMTVILVSHSMEDVAAYADRIIVMNGGGVTMDGTPAEVFAQADALKEIGLSVPAATEVCRRLYAAGIPVRPDVTTAEEACEEICGCFLR
ncbi:MAG: energy-coupling factor transporter ATPase [Lachnospiraceae bacterium]|nr:energy-coupling factor transporter ATPase [Lachnospiraceae bacterium]